jgi:hypothetical protein
MTVFMSRRHAYQAKLRHHFHGRHWPLILEQAPCVYG